MATVTFNGQLAEFQAAEDAFPGGHPKTTAIINDKFEILLGLFVPWDHLVDIFRRYTTKRDTCARVWAAVEPTFPFHNRGFARNVGLLRKSKEDCQADARLWRSENGAGDPLHHDVDGFEPTNFSSDGDEGDEYFQLQGENFTVEMLIAAYHSTRKAWHRETVITGRRIPPLLRAMTHRRFPLQILLPLGILHIPSFVPSSTLQSWEIRLKGFSNFDHEEITGCETATSSFALGDFDNQFEDNILQPTLANSDMAPAMHNSQLQVGQNPTGASLTSLVIEVIPLNHKQRMIVESTIGGVGLDGPPL